MPIMDILVRSGGEPRTIDLAEAFGRTDLSYQVVNSNGEVVSGAVDEATDRLTLSFGALGHSDLRIVATDPAGQTVATDSFRVRVAGENAYTIAVLPDTQDYTDTSQTNGPSSTFFAMTKWLADNKDAHNIQFVVHVGDITQNNRETEWDVAEPALRQLDGIIPYSLLPGNHDQASGGSAANHTTDPLDIRFSPEKQEAVSPDTFGGVYDQEPTRSANTYHTFTAPDGTKWLVLALEFGPRDDVIRWAGEVIEDHLDHRVIISSHAVTNWAGRHDPLGAPLYDEGAGYNYGMGSDPQGSNDGETLFRELMSKYPNVTFTFSGHIFGDGAETDLSYSEYGTPIHQFLMNYQNGVASEITGNGTPIIGNQGGNGAIRLIVVDPENDTVSTETYFVVLDDYLDGFRTKPELDRDGLTGPYRGHEEVIEMEVGTPEVLAKAKAGDDILATAAADADTAEVTLDARRSIVPAGEAVTYTWTDSEGNVVATGENPTVTLPVGQQALTLTVEDAAGHRSTDEVRVFVRGESTLLIETFDDGDLAGWRPGLTATTASVTRFGTASEFGLPALAGGDAEVMEFGKLTPSQGYKVDPGFAPAEGDNTFDEYSLVFDILVPSGQAAGSYTDFIQTNVNNTDDGELFLRANNPSTTGGIGISGQYTGTYTYGQWARVAFVLDKDDATGAVTLSKFINGVAAGSQNLGTDSRFKINSDTGFLLFSDESNETTKGFVNSFLFTDKVLSAAEVQALGGPDADGIASSAPSERSVQFDFDDGGFTPTFGDAALTYQDKSPFLVKGTVKSRPVAAEGEPAPEGALYDESNGTNNALIWGGEEARSWQDYVLEATLVSTDDDIIGVLFNYQDDRNYYKFTLDNQTNVRRLVKVEEGVETVLRSVEDGYRFNDELELKVATVDGRINVVLDGRDVFGGAVVDEDPLGAGTVGVLSSGQKRSIFDNITVNGARLTAEAGIDVRGYDADGDRLATVALDAGGSYGPADIVDFRWSIDGETIARGEEATADLAVGENLVTLTVTDAEGRTSTDTVRVEVFAADQTLLDEDFSDPALAGWSIVDESELGGAAAWSVTDGRLLQSSDAASRQLTWSGASNADIWKRGWSPLGDGSHALRKGTYALYDGEGAETWTDYSVEATFSTPDNDGLGFLFRYQDENNYYKLEIDKEVNLTQLTRMVDGVEELIGQFRGNYAINTETRLRVEVVDDKISAFLDGEALFPYAIEDRGLQSGTVGLYSWGSAGLRFDDVTVTNFERTIAGDLAVGVAEGGTVTINTGSLSQFDPRQDDEILAYTVTEETNGAVLVAGAAVDSFTQDQLEAGLVRFRHDGGEVDGSFAVRLGEEATARVTVAVTPADGEPPPVGATDRDDVLTGTNGDDEIHALAGGDRVNGGAGDDRLHGDDGRDFVFGGEGDDRVLGGDGPDKVHGGEGDDIVLGGAGRDIVYGGEGDDQVLGGDNRDQVHGGAGDDRLEGGAGDDALYGGSGRDILLGQAGDDFLRGGAGDDVFEFAGDFGRDRIADFDAGPRSGDIIRLDEDQFADFDAVMAQSHRAGGDTVIVFDAGNSIVLEDARLASLAADDFRFV